MLRVLLLALLGTSMGVSIGAAFMHVRTALRTKLWRKHIGYVTLKAGWAVTMFPILQLVNASRRISNTWQTDMFLVGVIITALGFIIVAFDTRSWNGGRTA